MEISYAYDVGRAANGCSFDVGRQANARWSVECWSLHYSSWIMRTVARPLYVIIIRGLRFVCKAVVLERHEAAGRGQGDKRQVCGEDVNTRV